MFDRHREESRFASVFMIMEKLVINSSTQKLELEYPCPWVYKVVGKEQDLIRQAIVDVFQERECLVTTSNSSRTGKYHCLNVEIVVVDEEDRMANYESLKKHPSVTMVL